MSVFKKCLLPHAITRRQKLFCGFAGAIVFAGTTTSIIYGGSKVLPLIDKKIRESSLPSIHDDDIIKNLAILKYGNWTELPVIRGTMFFGGLAGMVFYSLGLCGLHLKIRNDIRGTTKCCNIIRSTMVYCTLMPLFGFVTVTSAWVWNSSFGFTTIISKWIDHMRDERNK